MPKNNQIKGKQSGKRPVNEGKNLKDNRTRYNAEPGSRDKSVEINIQKVKDLYEKLNQMTDAERQEKLDLIGKQLRQTEGIFTEIAMEKLEISEEIGEKPDEEVKKLLKENIDRQMEVAKSRRSLEMEKKKIELFPKVKKAVECVDNAKKEIELKKAETIEKLEAKREVIEEKIEEFRRIDEEIKASIDEYGKALTILSNAGANQDVIDSIQDNIRQKQEELGEIDIEGQLQEIDDIEKQLEIYKSGKTKYDLWINRCEDPFGKVFKDKSWEQIANMELKEIHFIIANGVKEKEKDKVKDNTQVKKDDSEKTGDNKGEKLYEGDQAAELRKRMQGRSQGGQGIVQTPPPAPKIEPEEEEPEKKEPEEAEKKEPGTDLEPQKNWFARKWDEIKNWYKAQKEKSSKAKEQYDKRMAQKNEKYINEIKEAGKEPTKARILWQRFADRMLGPQDLYDDRLFEDDGRDYSLDREEIRKGRKQSRNSWAPTNRDEEANKDEIKIIKKELKEDTTVKSGPSTEGAQVPRSKGSKERYKNTAEGLQRAMEAGKNKVEESIIAQQTHKERERRFKEELKELTPQEIQAERDREATENERKVKVQTHADVNKLLTGMSKAAQHALGMSEGKSAPSAPSAPGGRSSGGDAR